MALSPEEEKSVKQMLTAFQNGQTIGQLPKADKNDPSDIIIEGMSKKTGESVQVDLSSAIVYMNKRVAIRRKKVAHASGKLEPYGNIDFLRELPYVLGIGCYNVMTDRSRRKLAPSTHNRYADGAPAKLDGTEGDYMWCWNGFYYAWWIEGEWYYEAVSLEPIKGQLNYYIPAGGISALSGAVIDREKNIMCSVVSEDPKFRGGNNDHTRDGSQKTQLGRVASNMSVSSFSTLARKKGEGWDADWFVANRAVEIIMRMVMGTTLFQNPVVKEKDANGLFQGGLGKGVTGLNYSTWVSFNDRYPLIPTSLGIEMGDFTGEIPYQVKNDQGETVFDVKVPCFFGLKNMYGHIGHIENGTVMNKLADGSADYYVAATMAKPFNINSIEGLIKATNCPANQPAGWKYISQLSMQNLCGAPTVCEASETTYYGDGWYNDNATSGLRASFRRGFASGSGVAGPAYLSGSYAVSIASADWSSPLSYFAEDVSPVPVQY